MADIYLVLTESALGFDKIQVLKRPRFEAMDDEATLAMFLDEGRLATRLEHPNIVRTTEVEVYDGKPYIAMEYVDGLSLHRLVHEVRRRNVEVELETWLGLVIDVLHALEYAHELSDFDGRPLEIVHRDISPGNVMLSFNGTVKLCDFGVAKAKLHSANTNAGTIKGKASHLAPECLLGKEADARADLYSVGVLLWSCVAEGKLPWSRPLDLEQRAAPPSLSSVVPSIPPELDAVLSRALSPDPESRHATAAELREDLETIAGNRPRRAERRRLVARLEEVMATGREELRQLIRHRVTELKRGEHRETADLPRLSGIDSVAPEPTSVSVVPDPVPPRTSPAARLSPALVGILLGAAGLLLVLQPWDRDDAPAPPGAPVDTRPPALPTQTDTVTPSTAREAADEIEIYVVVVPSHATIRVDGTIHDGNPLTLTRRRDGREHVLEASAAGYRTKRVTLRFDESRDVKLALEGLPLPDPTPTSVAVVPGGGGAPAGDVVSPGDAEPQTSEGPPTP